MRYLATVAFVICLVVSSALACQENAEYKCGTLCPKNCDNLYLMMKCIAGCKFGCFCKEGYVFENNDSKNCVPRESCYSYCDDTKHEYYMDRFQCPCIDPENCDSCMPGCYCLPGYERNAQGVCIVSTTNIKRA